MLTVPQTMSLCGYSAATIEHRFQKNFLEGIRYREMILLFKESLAEWMASNEGQSIQRQSVKHQELIEEFQAQELKQENSGMGFGTMSL